MWAAFCRANVAWFDKVANQSIVNAKKVTVELFITISNQINDLLKYILYSKLFWLAGFWGFGVLGFWGENGFRY